MKIQYLIFQSEDKAANTTTYLASMEASNSERTPSHAIIVLDNEYIHFYHKIITDLIVKPVEVTVPVDAKKAFDQYAPGQVEQQNELITAYKKHETEMRITHKQTLQLCNQMRKDKGSEMTDDDIILLVRLQNAINVRIRDAC